MADNVAITAGAGTTVATDDVGGVQHQRVKVEWGADGVATDVSSAAPLPVNIAASQGSAASAAGALTAAATNTPGTAVTVTTSGQVICAVATSGNATFHLVATAFVGTVVFEGSLDGGLNYAPVMAIREDGTGGEASAAISTAAAFIRAYTVGIPGFTHFRVRASVFTSGSLGVLIQPGPFLIETSPSLAASAAIIGAIKKAPSGTGTVTSVAAAAASTLLLAANANRLGATFYNESTQTLYLALAGSASLTAYTIQIAPYGYYELPNDGCGYVGSVYGIWGTAVGSVRVTELT